MTRSEILSWLHQNLSEWPICQSNRINIPDADWHWHHLSGSGAAVISYDTGDLITHDDFLLYRTNHRLDTCGMSFEEMIEDLKV